MAVEDKRILKMLYLLSQKEGYLKAGDLAIELNLSERTVKNDIGHLREVARNCGCILKSVRGKGYILEIDEPERFAQTREWINILFNNVEKDVREKQTYQMARAIMCGQAADQDDFFRLEDLAVSLYLSLSTVKKKMPWVREFLASFGLRLVSCPGKGLKVIGDEFGKRLCMLELYENHFRTRVVAFDNHRYERAFVDREDKDLIRKISLNAIRNSDNELFDTYVNRFVDYILIQRNRVLEGNEIEQVEPVWQERIEELQKRPEWETSRKLFEKLQVLHDFTLPSESEIAAVAVLLLIWGDWEQYTDLDERFPEIYSKARHLTDEMTVELEELWQIPEGVFKDKLEGTLVPEFVRILVQKHFGFEHCQMLGNAISENSIKKSPLTMALADSIRFMFQKEGLLLSEYNTQLLAVSIFDVLDAIPYPYQKRRILICARNGKRSALVMERKIRRQLGSWWIESVDIEPLYEARKYPTEMYDCVIGSFVSYAYRYSWPYIEVQSMMDADDFEKVRRGAVSMGYKLDYLSKLISWDVLEFHHNFSVSGLDGLLQLLAYQWGKDIYAKERLAEFFSDSSHLRSHHHLLTAIAPVTETGKNVFELYFMDKPLEFGEKTVRVVLFFSADFSAHPALVRFWEHAIRLLQKQIEIMEKELKTDTIISELSDKMRNEL